MKYVLKINTLHNTANCNRHFFPSCSLEWYYWTLLGLAGIVAILVLTCCCCCCCSCCRSKKPRGGGVVQMTRKYLARFHKMILWMSLRNVYHIHNNTFLSCHKYLFNPVVGKPQLPRHIEFGCFFPDRENAGNLPKSFKIFCTGNVLGQCKDATTTS